MKNLCTFLCLFFLLTVSILSQEPTDAGIPDANHVLVVYNSNSSVSDSVMQYYVAARGIPDPSNIVPLRFPDTTFAINGITHTVG